MKVDGLERLHWEVLPESAFGAAMNASLDEVLLDAAIAGRRGPTLRFWAWSGKAVILGRHQSVANEVRENVLRDESIELSRRMTGGGAMYSEPDRVITYSMIFPDSAVDGLTLVESFEHCDRWAVEALRHLDVDASYKPINDIVSPVGKIGGAAQFRRDGWVLHHTMIAHSIDLDAMCRVLRIGEVKLSDKGVRSAVKRVSPLAALSGQSREAMREGMIDFVRSRWTTSPSALRSEELVEAERLVTAKYGTLDWKRKIL